MLILRQSFGREANLLDIEMSYQGLYKAIQKGEGLEGTIEFFLRKENIILTGTGNAISALLRRRPRLWWNLPCLWKKITIGVDHRVMQLQTGRWRSRKNKKPYENLVPLPEVIAASTGKSSGSKRVQEQYENNAEKLGI